MKSLHITLYLIATIFLDCYSCGFVLHGSENSTSFIKNEIGVDAVFRVLPWETSSNLTTKLSQSYQNVTSAINLVSIDASFGAYDPCDENTFTPDAIQELLLHHGVTNNGQSLGNWVALIDEFAVTSHCNGQYPFHLFYASYAALSVQKLGASALLQLVGVGPMHGIGVVPPDVDISEKTIKGEKVSIAVFHTSKHIFYDTVGNIINANESVYISGLKEDVNPLFDAIQEPFGFYHMSCLSLSLASFIVMVLSIIECRVVFKYYKGKTGISERLVLFTRMMILIPIIITSFTRLLVGIDPFGVFYIFDYFSARLLAKATQAVSLFTDIMTALYCHDVYNVFKASKDMKKSVPYLIRHKIKGTIIIILAFLMMVVDIVILYQGLIGNLGSTTIAIPLLYMLFMSVAVMIRLCQVSHKMKIEVADTVNSLEKRLKSSNHPKRNAKILNSNKIGCDTSKASIVNKKGSSGRAITSTFKTSNSTHRSSTSKKARIPSHALEKSKKLLKMRQYIFYTILGRVMWLLSIILLAFGVVVEEFSSDSAIGYFITFTLMFWSSFMCSVTQMLSAAQLPGERKHPIYSLSMRSSKKRSVQDEKTVAVPTAPAKLESKLETIDIV